MSCNYLWKSGPIFKHLSTFRLWIIINVRNSIKYISVVKTAHWKNQNAISDMIYTSPCDIVQWIFDLRKFLGTAKNFLKSKIFLKSNILKQWNMQVLAGYQTPAQKIELFSCSIALLFLFRMLSHENKQCFLNIS